jgi:2-C-methyl-D-erythritol 4-phosphate cytidylyltransferase
MSTWSIVLAAGRGRRYDPDALKQYEKIGERRVIDLSLARARVVSDGVVLVVAPEYLGDPEPLADVVVAGGEQRSDSVRRGLAVVHDDDVAVVGHDGARPLASVALFEAVIEAVLAGADAAIPGLPVTDTIKRVDEGRVVDTVDRDELVAVQTPQAFRADVLRDAHDGDPQASDDAALVEEVGGLVVVVPGDRRNLKITSPGDLALVADQLDGRWGEARPTE